MKIFTLALIALGLLSASPGWSQETTKGTPVIRLDKTQFATGENVRFWIGVQEDNHQPVIGSHETCRLTITRPDGTQKTDTVSWPRDGLENSGWIGGWGLGTEKPQRGRYTLVFAFAGQKTDPVSFTVVDVPILKRITASFVFPAKATFNPGSVVTLTVQNHSDQAIRFPHPDGVNAMVWVDLVMPDGSGSQDFYPPDKLLDVNEPVAPNFSIDAFTWGLAAKIPTITLKPGETYRQPLSLAAALPEPQLSASYGPGKYHITFSTTLQVLVGEPDGPWAGLAAIRVPVINTADVTRK